MRLECSQGLDKRMAKLEISGMIQIIKTAAL